MKKQLKALIEILESEEGNEKKIEEAQHDVAILNAALSDLNYAIEWINTGKRPGAIRGIERQSVYKREVPFENKWLDVLIDDGVRLHEIKAQNEETDEMKSDLVKEIKKELTPKQVQVFEMLAQGMGQKEIADAIGVTKQAVNELITRGKKSIRQAGWVMA